jgi:hypothetical protein
MKIIFQMIVFILLMKIIILFIIKAQKVMK